MRNRIQMIINALNEIEVKGEQNLNLLLASIQELNKIMAEETDETHPE